MYTEGFSHKVTVTGSGTGGQGIQISHLLYLTFPAPARISWLPPISPFSIAKYQEPLHNFRPFLPLLTLSELLPSPLTSSASPTPPTPYSSGLPPLSSPNF